MAKEAEGWQAWDPLLKVDSGSDRGLTLWSFLELFGLWSKNTCGKRGITAPGVRPDLNSSECNELSTVFDQSPESINCPCCCDRALPVWQGRGCPFARGSLPFRFCQLCSLCRSVENLGAGEWVWWFVTGDVWQS